MCKTTILDGLTRPIGLLAVAVVLFVSCDHATGTLPGDAITTLRFQSPAGELQDVIEQVEVRVSATDMQTIHETIDVDDGSVTLEVPTGSRRLFEVEADFVYGRQRQDVSSGESTLEMQLDYKLLVPDRYNRRIVRLSSIFGGWEEMDADILDLQEDLLPDRMAIDRYGRILLLATPDFANGEQDFALLRIDEFGNDPVDLTGQIDRPGAEQIAVTQEHYFVLFGDGQITPLAYDDTDNVTSEDPFYSALDSTQGFSADSSGYLYLSGSQTVHKIDPAEHEEPIESFAFDENTEDLDDFYPRDAAYVGRNRLAVVNDWDEDVIVLFDTSDLSILEHFGREYFFDEEETDLDPQPGEFYSPSRMHVLPSGVGRVVVTDRMEGYDYSIEEYTFYNRLVQAHDGSAQTWATFGSTGEGRNEFRFIDDAPW